MKIESLFLIGVGIFFGVIGLIYWFTSYEDGGFLMLLGTCALGFLPGSYYFFWHRRFHGHKYFVFGKLDRTVGDRPEDRSDAEIADGAGVISSFPGSSIWPFFFGAAAFMVLLSFAFGIWMIIPGVVLVVIAVVGATVESRRGGRV